MSKKPQPIQAAARAQAAGKVKPPKVKAQRPPKPLFPARKAKRYKPKPCRECKGTGQVSVFLSRKTKTCQHCGGSGNRMRVGW